MVKIHDFGGKECPIVLVKLTQETIKNKVIVPPLLEKIEYRYSRAFEYTNYIQLIGQLSTDISSTRRQQNKTICR
ncbi:hypothetical protein Rhsp01_54000 [Rhizobium sp. NBRC 114257]|uniref:Uncharacterized protein n=1 Tax=Rhizobium dioscoreae TaxID=2653122 RepID=A0ABQ0Z8W2_9HYPH|nr:hypothetical protein RsS93_45580 [Rhizobium dioscoreae]GLU84224.1 hypothetical protein Rhsp01_54000 [Rhizobium sp. NBRC 114257]